MTGADVAMNLRHDVESWLEQWWDPERPLREWRGLLADSGWGCPTWPTEWYGRGLSKGLAAGVAGGFAGGGGGGPAAGAGMGLAAPTHLEHGSPDARRLMLAPTGPR